MVFVCTLYLLKADNEFTATLILEAKLHTEILMSQINKSLKYSTQNCMLLL